MNRIQRIVILVVILAVILAAVALFATRNAPAPQESVVQDTAKNLYQSDRYGFSFDVPSGFKTFTYTDESVAIGTPLPEGEVEAVANVRVYSTGADVTYENFDAYLLETLRNMCAADGPRGTIYCTDIDVRQPFVSASGLTGEVIYLDRTHENFETSEKQVDGWGPIFVFNLQANVPAAQFAFVAVEPPAHLPASAVQSEQLRQVADSFALSRIESRRGETVVALVNAVGERDGSTVITFDPVEWLDGEAAIEAAAADTACDIANAEECVPSLNNDFYVRNVQEESSVYPIASSTSVALIEEARTVERTVADLVEKLRTYDTLMVRMTLEAGEVVSVEEVYLP